jgi:putative aminopeptidase FrvX
MEIPADARTVVDLFTRLLAVPTPSGSERQIAALVRQIITEIGFEAQTDSAGNVLVRFAGQEPTAGLCILAAHIDEIGIVVKTVNPDGTLQISNSGGLLPWKIGERPVELLGDAQTITGVTSFGAGHGGNLERAIRWDDMKVITGLSAEQLAQAGVRPGTCGVPLRSQCGPVLLGDPADPLIAAWTFDDRMGVAALLRLLQIMKSETLQPRRPTIIAFTIQEETGCQGALALAQREHPEVFISIDGSPIPPGSGLALDGRPAIWSMDRLGHFDQDLLRFIMRAARDAGTDIQPVVQLAAACDASKVYAAGAAARAADFGHVRENSHGYEVSRLSVFENVVKVLSQFIRAWK